MTPSAPSSSWPRRRPCCFGMASRWRCPPPRWRSATCCSSGPAPGQRLADRAAFWLVLVALVGGAVTLLVWLAVGAGFAAAILFAITFVVIACPDALGLATPMAIMVGTGLAAKRGILFKNAVALETSARITTVVMDKTGTLTRGEPEV